MDCKVYPLTAAEKPKLEVHIVDMLEKGFIHPSKSNSITEPDRFPLPLLQEMIDKVEKAKLFSKVDVRKGFYNIHVTEGDEWKAAFKTNSGLYEPMVMPFGLKNALAVFQRMMNTQLADLIAQGHTIIYMDDILIATENDPVVHRRVVGQVLD